MTPLPVLTPAAVLRTLERAGFVLHHVKGSHHYLKHPDRPNLRVTVPFHRKDLPPIGDPAVVALNEARYASLGRLAMHVEQNTALLVCSPRQAPARRED